MGEPRIVGGIDYYGNVSFMRWGQSSMDGTKIEMESIIEPIPLTLEILEKAGFDKIKGWWVNKNIDTCHIVLIEAGEIFKVSVTGPFGMVSTKSIKYLHQLQNLYFALTGDELPINLYNGTSN